MVVNVMVILHAYQGSNVLILVKQYAVEVLLIVPAKILQLFHMMIVPSINMFVIIKNMHVLKMVIKQVHVKIMIVIHKYFVNALESV